ncbi:MAG: cation-translocating P-type ATPase [Phycisphaerae bacterium]|jgi:Cd2+/Zn2+-exporting ATPase|nr:cation-translocating P-type ATPase [Phycisphaerae bacterium]
MAHDILNESVEAQTGRASLFILAILFGGVLVVNAYIADWLFEDNFYGSALALIGAILLGLPIIIHAFAHLIKGQMHMDELVALAIAAAIAGGNYKSAGVVAFFLLLANLIETRTALGAKASIESLIRLSPTKAHRLGAGGSEELVEPRSLIAGDIIRIRPGDNIPADGDIISGQSSVNQANVTGESLPVDKSEGDEVFSGTTNISGSIDVRVTRAGADTTLGKVRKLILEAQKTRIPMMRMIDCYAGWYTPTILMLAGAVLVFTQDMNRAIAMLVVACPCAIILAVPTAMVAALSCAARLGILIKDVSNIEAAKDITAFVFDKTGTLTTGELSVTRMMPAPNVDGAVLLAAAAAAEQRSKHPVAKAIGEVARKANITPVEPTEFTEAAGLGVRAKVDGNWILVGRKGWLVEQGIDISPLSGEQYAEPEGLSTLFVASGPQLLGWIGLEDRTRQEARDAIGDLQTLGIKEIVMVTGDRWSVARRVAREMGCTEVQAEVLPADKLKLVDALKEQGRRVAVAGDGVNDAPALAAGDLSIAMGAAGSDVAINSASIVLMNNNLDRLGFLIRLSRRTTSVIHQSLGFGVVFVVVFMILAGMGYLHAITGALLHLLAAAFVILNSARLVRFGEELQEAPPQETAPPEVKLEPVAAT